MKTLTTLSNLFNSLSTNTSTANTALGKQLISDQQRYLLQRYFDNERTATTTTVGSMTISLTIAPDGGATSATMTAVWAYQTGEQIIYLGNSQQRTALFTYNSATITWTDPLADSTGDSGDSITTAGFQSYRIPANISKITDSTVNVGQLKFVPAPVQSRAEWDLLNFLPYNSDIPNMYFIYQNQLLLYPIPSTTGNIITFNYKVRVPDLTFTDYTTGSLSGIASGSYSITGVGTAWATTGAYPLNTDLSFFNLALNITPPSGDGIWYPISKFTSTTALTLQNPIVNAPSATAALYTIGQLPLLSEDFHDMLVYGALCTYYTSIVPDPAKFKQFDALYKIRLELLKDYAGTKSINVDLGAQPQFSNPNLYPYPQSST